MMLPNSVSKKLVNSVTTFEKESEFSENYSSITPSMITLNLILDSLLGSEYGKINRPPKNGPLKLKSL